MKYYEWDKDKNNWLKNERDISFEEVVIAIDNGMLITITDNANKKKYPNQKVYVVIMNNYVYLVPYIEDEKKIFLKTIIPSRKATKKYLLKIKS